MGKIINNKVVKLSSLRKADLSEFVEDFDNDRLSDVILVYTKDGQPYFRIATDSTYANVGWSLIRSAFALYLDEAYENEED